MRRISAGGFVWLVVGLVIGLTVVCGGCLPDGTERYGVNGPIQSGKNKEEPVNNREQQAAAESEPSRDLISQPTPPRASYQRDDGDKTMAWVMCQDFVKRRLKAPSQASFGSIWDGTYQDSDKVVTYLGSSKYRIVAWVEAPNSFGVMLRQTFVCELRYAGNDRWVVESLIMEEDLGF